MWLIHRSLTITINAAPTTLAHRRARLLPPDLMLSAHRAHSSDATASSSPRSSISPSQSQSQPHSSVAPAPHIDRRLYSIMQQVVAPGAFARPAPIRVVDTAGCSATAAPSSTAATPSSAAVAAAAAASSSSSAVLSPGSSSAESPLGVGEDASLALSSRQIPLFQQGNTQLRKAEPTNIVIDEVTVHNIPRIHDHLPNLAAFPNRFARTKASMMQRAALGGSGKHARNTQPASAALLRGGSHAHLPVMGGGGSTLGDEDDVGYKQLIKEGDVVLLDIVRRSGLAGKPAFGGAKSFVRAGPREHICWAPGEAVAAIVTCGGCLWTRHTAAG